MILFKPCSTFDVAYNIYKFDSELRKLIITELEKIEVAVRTQTAYTFFTMGRILVYRCFPF
ncbi:Abi family protein [Bacteroides fragilis]|nr:Abi family protein [Bacteroides fragilis]